MIEKKTIEVEHRPVQKEVRSCIPLASGTQHSCDDTARLATADSAIKGTAVQQMSGATNHSTVAAAWALQCRAASALWRVATAAAPVVTQSCRSEHAARFL